MPKSKPEGKLGGVSNGSCKPPHRVPSDIIISTTTPGQTTSANLHNNQLQPTISTTTTSVDPHALLFNCPKTSTGPPSNFSDAGSDSKSQVDGSNTAYQQHGNISKKAVQLSATMNTTTKLSNRSHPISDQSDWMRSWLVNDRTPTEQYQKVYDWMESSTMPLPGVISPGITKNGGGDVPLSSPLSVAAGSSSDEEDPDGGYSPSPEHRRLGGGSSRLLGSMLSIYSLRQTAPEVSEPIPQEGSSGSNKENIMVPGTPLFVVQNQRMKVSPTHSETTMEFPCTSQMSDDRVLDTEVSHVGDSTTSRSDLKLAKKERRQRQKDGNVDEAFADNNMGKSCEDEGMEEILVVPPILSITLSTKEEEREDAWASPILDSDAGPPQTPLNKQSDLRRGKRELMRSWLATPTSGEGSVSFPPAMSTPLSTSTPSWAVHEDAPPDAPPHTSCRPSPATAASSSITSFNNSSLGSVLSHLFLFSSYNSDDNPLSRSASSDGGQGSVKQSRPRETLHSIKAFRQLENSADIDEDDIPILPPALLDLSFVKNIASSFTSSFSTVAVDSNTVPSPNRRHGVTFNADAYNLDAWDSALLGPFALTTDSSDVPPRSGGGVNDTGSECTADTVSSNTVSSALPTCIGVPLANVQNASSHPPQCALIPVYGRSVSNTTSETQEYLHTEPPQQDLFSSLPFSPSIASNTTCSPPTTTSPTSPTTTTTTNVLTGGAPAVGAQPPPLLAGNKGCLSEFSSHRAYIYHVGVRHAISVSSSILQTNCSYSTTPSVMTAPRSLLGGGGHVMVSSYRGRSRDTRLGATPSLLASSSLLHGSSSSFSDVVSRYVTVDTLVHTATSYTHQLANPTSGAGHRKFRREQERWLADSDQQHQQQEE